MYLGKPDGWERGNFLSLGSGIILMFIMYTFGAVVGYIVFSMVGGM